MTGRLSRTSLLCATALVGVWGAPALAQGAPAGPTTAVVDNGTNQTVLAYNNTKQTGVETVVVTGSRRRVSLQDSTINISAVSSNTLQDQRVDDIQQLGGYVPGITVSKTGPGSTGDIIMRGLSSADTSTFGANRDNAVGVYLGNVPLYLDFKLIDIKRVEVLQGPQGTLYGLGTLAGAVRYIPKRPNTDGFTAEFHGRGYTEAHSNDLGGEGDVTINVPIWTGHIAFRTATGYYNNAGFIDYPYLLKQPGISNPQPVRATPGSTGSFGTPAQIAKNFYRVNDVNYDHTFTSRNQLLLQYNPDIKAYLTYAIQDTRTGGRQANGAGVLGTGKYIGPWRYLSPVHRQSQLYSAEIYANLFDFAQLVSTTAYTDTTYHDTGDNTDLLLDLNYGYEDFPNFSSYAHDVAVTRQFDQEVRLVSTGDGPFSWVIGGFYNSQTYDRHRHEYTPGFAQYENIPRPDNLEYISELYNKTTEKAVYGEATYHVTDKWQVTGGIRYFHYQASVIGGADTPLFGSGLTGMPYPSTTIPLAKVRKGDTGKSGMVWKANTSYKFNKDLLAYFTYSTGYRVGGVNRVVPCILPLPAGQNLCALPNELVYGPDHTNNADLGVRATLLDGRLRLDSDIFHIDWTGVQVPSQTVNGAIGITVNGANAVSQGFDFQGTFKVTPNLTVNAMYSYVDAHLTENVPGLVVSQGIRYEAYAGDRLPGSAKHSGSLRLMYTYPLGDDAAIQANWATVYHGDIYTRVGLRGHGEIMPDYFTHSLSVNYITDRYEVGVYADNLTDTYAVTAVSNDLSSYNQVRTDVVERYYARSVLTPRRIGIDFRIHM